MKCNICNKEFSPDCDYNQGRCPHLPSMAEEILNSKYKTRYYDLVQKIKAWFNKKQ
jgi:hypothetical protein